MNKEIAHDRFTMSICVSKGGRLVLALMAATYLVAPSQVMAQVKAANSATNVYKAANGVPVVDIANPNGAGLSHNKYTDYNVDTHGLVLNNGDSSQIQRQSQLAGAVSANLNLSRSANVILNEVVSTNRSNLAGFTEVLGASADVVVANPNGITCNGCGFINTPHATLSTGAPTLNGSGGLSGFHVDNGDILITGAGADGSRQDYLTLIGRSIKLEAQANTKQLDVIAGPNDVDYATLAATPHAATGTAPTYAIDSSAMGGMYADRIHLVATENGVGVRALGDAAAGVGDFSIDSAGKVEVGGKISAQQDVKITSTANGTDAIKATNSSLSAHRDIALTANSGQAHLAGGSIKADRDLNITSASLTDESTNAASADNNKRYAAHNLTLSQTGAISLDDTSFGAANLFTLDGDTLSVGADGETLYGDALSFTTGHDMDLGKAGLRATHDIGLISTLGLISIGSGAGQGVQSTAGNISLTAATGLTNGGTITADGGNLTARVSDLLTNNGTMHAYGTLDAADQANAATENLINTGTILADNTLTLKGGTFSNNGAGSILQGTGTSNITLTQLTNAGTVLLSKDAAGGGTLTVNTITNNATGILQSLGDLNLNIGTQLTNSASGQILAGDALTVRGRTASAYNVDNYSIIKAAGLLDIKGNGGGGMVDFSTDGADGDYIGNTVDVNARTVAFANNSGMTSQHNMTFGAATLTFGGSGAYLVAAKGVGTTDLGTITLANAFSNDGVVFSGRDLDFSAPSITNNANGALAANHNMSAEATAGNFYNYGQLYGSNQMNAQASSNLVNEASGRMDSSHDMSLTADTFYNYNEINASNDIGIHARQFYNQVAGGDQRSLSAVLGDSTSTGSWSHDPNGFPFTGTSADRSNTRTYHYDESYDVTPTEADKGKIIANHAITIDSFTYASNLGSVISAPSVTISGLSPGAQFINDSYDTVRYNYTETWSDHAEECDVIYICYTYGNNDTTSHTTTTLNSFGAGIYANALIVNNSTALSNVASVYGSPSVSTKSSSGGASGASGSGGATFGGITITLPTSPNGIFVTSQDPNSHYLVETNPMYSVGSSFLGSDYMLTHYGVDPDQIERRLGDANYEAYLIKDQLTTSGAAMLLNTGGDPGAAMQKLMDNGVDQGKALGLKIGTAPTTQQLAGLKSDMVWMVDTVVNGQHVLAPQVFLSAATQSQIASGAVIQANDATMQLASLTNTGGTIAVKNDLNVTSQGDITNTSGTIKGGNVSLASTDGSIVNQTVAETSGGEGNQHTDIGNTASISSTGDLNLDAKKDITNKGADMSAGGDASLKAGKDITFDTVEDKESSSTSSGQNNNVLGGGTYSTSTTSSTTNKKSGLSVGGNLKTDSGNDTTFAGTDVNVGGNADVKAGGDLNILARNDSTETTTHSESGNVFNGDSHDAHDKETTNLASNFNVGGDLGAKSGGDTTIKGSNVAVKGNGSIDAGGNLNILDGQDTSDTSESGTHTGAGVGGGLYGTSTTTDTNQKGTSVASNLNFGGNGSLKSGKDITVQGSNVEADGDLGLDAKNNINVLEGRNTETSSHTESTTTFGKVDMGAGYEPPADEEKPEEEKGGVNVHAEAKAETDEEDHGGVTLSETDINSTTHHTDTASGSSIKSGGNMNVKAGNDVNLRGSTVEAGGDADINAKNVNVMAAKNIDTTTTSSTTAKTGLYGSTHNSAGADAQANAHAQADGEGSPNASADASAKAEAGTENTLDLVRVDQSSNTSTDVTHTGSAIKSGGNTNVTADNKLNVNGSSMESGGDMNLNAKDMSFTAANDSHTESSTDSHTRAGLYADAGADAGANANASAEGMSAGASAGAEANANAGVGLYGSNTTNTGTSGSTHAVTSSIKSGGNMTRTADNNITDEGTQIEAGGDFTQSSKSWDSKAAHDTSYSNTTSESNKAKLGLYAEANAGASGSASTMDGVNNDNGANASAGLSASYNRNTDDESSDSSHAVVSNIKSGGNMKTTTSDKTSLEGTNLASGGDMELNAGSLDYKAAHDTESSSSSKTNADAGLKVGVDVKKKVTVTAEGGYGENNSSESSDHAVVGSMTSGGNMKVNTKGDANFEGTNLDAGGDAAIKAGGDVNFKAAHDTQTSHEDNLDASASISASKSKSASGGKGKTGMGLEAEASYDTSDSSSDTATAGSIKSGGNLDISAGKSANFEGTKMDAGGDTAIEAKDDVNFKAAKSTSSSTGWGVGGSLSTSKETSKDGSEKSAGLGLSGNYSKENETTSDAVGINSGGNVKVKAGHDMNLEGTNVSSGGETALDAGHDVNFTAAENTSNKVSVGAEIGGETSTSQEKGGTATKEKGGSFGLDVEGGTSSTKTGGSIKAGAIKIKSGNDTTLEGTQTESSGATSIDAGGNVNLKAANSTHVEGGIGGGAGSNGGGLTKASIGGGSENQTVNMKSGSDLNISSGGKTTLQGTTLDAGDHAVNLDAKGGVDKQTVVSGGAHLGLDHAGADFDAKGVDITSNGKTESSGGLDQLKSDVSGGVDSVKSSITDTAGKVADGVSDTGKQLQDATSKPPALPPIHSMDDANKVKTKLASDMDKIKNDPSLSADQKKQKIAEIENLQKELDKQIKSLTH